jgi:hypothetical protein
MLRVGATGVLVVIVTEDAALTATTLPLFRYSETADIVYDVDGLREELVYVVEIVPVVPAALGRYV